MLLAVFVALAAQAGAQTIQINRDNKTIAISATDEAAATADIAVLTIGFEIYRPDAATATSDGGALSHKIVDALHQAGVEDSSIESRSQLLSRNTTFEDKEPEEARKLRAFRLDQSWEVTSTVKDATTVLQVALAAGANASGNIDWRYAERKALQAKAAANALEKARGVASQMADGLHVKLGALIYASNEVPEARISFAQPHSLAYGNGMGAGGGGVGRSIAMPLEIRPQTIRDEATVYAVFAIE
jgi:uncharacterized protein YggE